MSTVPGDIEISEVGSLFPALLSPYGRTLNITDIELSREQRTAGGRLVRDVIAVKKLFAISYTMVDYNPTLKNLLGLYGTQSPLSLKIHYANGFFSAPDEIETYTVLMRPFSRTRVLASVEAYGGLWGDISVEFEEI